MVFLLFFFFFKQKTAYEMRISDWSSDVCSSDLRHALPHHARVHLVDLTPVEQQLARTPRFVIVPIAVTEFGNITVDQPNLIAFHLGIALGDGALAEAQRFDLGPLQRDPRLEHLLDRIVEARAPVLGDNLLLVEFGGGLRTGHFIPASLRPRTMRRRRRDRKSTRLN